MATKIYAYKQGSASALALSAALGIKCIKHVGSKFKGRERHTVINWGSSQLTDEVLKCQVLNAPENVKLASNKLEFFKRIRDFNVQQGIGEGDHPEPRVSIPDWTEDKEVVAAWLRNGVKVVARQKLTGHSGEGIVIFEGEADTPPAPLYVRYVKKTQEFRVHVFKDGVVDVQRKARSKDVPDDQVNWQVRNHANGFIYAREGFETPEGVEEQAVLAIKACGLDFGAVDIIYNERDKRPYTLEVNTAPGLTGQTLAGYVERFKEYV